MVSQRGGRSGARRIRDVVIMATIALGWWASTARAQHAPRLFLEETAMRSSPALSGPRPLALAKWTTLGAAATLAGLGFAASAVADDRFRTLEARCGREAGEQTPEGRYVDPALERLREEGVEADRRAKVLLLAGQIGLVASIALFILDLSNAGPTPNIPFEPPAFRIGPSRDSGVLVMGRVSW